MGDTQLRYGDLVCWILPDMADGDKVHTVAMEFVAFELVPRTLLCSYQCQDCGHVVGQWFGVDELCFIGRQALH